MLFLNSKNGPRIIRTLEIHTYNDLKLVLGMSTIFDISVRDVYDVKKKLCKEMEDFFIELVMYNYKILCTFFY